MATSVQSLFGITPEAYQAQRDAALEERALQFSKMTPMQQAQMGLFRGFNQLGTGIGQFMGAKDPEMERIKARQGLLGGVDMNDPESLMRAARAVQATDPMAAQELMRMAQQASLSSAQIGAERAKATEAQAKLEQEQAAYAMRFQALKTRNPDMSDEVARAVAQDPVAFRETLKDPDVDPGIIDTPKGQQLIDRRTGKVIATFDPKPTKPSMGSEIAAGLAPLVGAIAGKRAESAGSAEGKEVGASTAQIQGKYDALAALNKSLQILGNAKDGYNIYAGAFGPEKTFVAKATGGLAFDREKAINSENFMAEISTTVIPMLQEFGGNDSNEELRFLQRVVGGDQRLEPESIERIIKSAISKVQRGIRRVQAQQSATEQGQPLPTGSLEPLSDVDLVNKYLTK